MKIMPRLALLLLPFLTPFFANGADNYTAIKTTDHGVEAVRARR